MNQDNNFKWFNDDTMAVKRTDCFTYTIWKRKDDLWECSINLNLEHGLVNCFANGVGISWSDSVSDARMSAMKNFVQLYNKV